MRGVYVASVAIGLEIYGSSPHARGLLAHRGQRHGGPTDHPRMRGVYETPIVSGRGRHGSSPHARGLHLAGQDRPDVVGIIPACAGFTPAPARY